LEVNVVFQAALKEIEVIRRKHNTPPSSRETDSGVFQDAQGDGTDKTDKSISEDIVKRGAMFCL
jgi:hypothetical protein